MQPPRRKSLAVLMVSVTTIGVLLSVFLIVEIWRLRQPVILQLKTGIEQTSAILQTTSEGLDVIDQVVGNVYSSTLYLDDATNALAQTISSTDSFIDSAGTFVGEDLINTITNTQKTLNTAKSSALVIDNIMSALSRVPLIGIRYDSSQPLNTALGQVSASLNPFQSSLKSFQANLETTRQDMQVFYDQLTVLEQNIKAIGSNLDSSRQVIDKYRSQVVTLQSWMEKAHLSISTWVNTACWILTITILWLVFIQVGIFVHGYDQLTTSTGAREVPVDK